MSGLSYLQTVLTTSWMWDAQNTFSGPQYGPNESRGPVQYSQSFGTDTLNGTLGGADELASYLVSINYNGSGFNTLTINAQAVTNILQQTVNLARILGFRFRLLSVNNDAQNGTACSSISIGNAPSNSLQFNLAAGQIYTIYTGGDWNYFDQTGTGFLVSGSANSIYIVNNDVTWPAAVQIFLLGATT